MKKGKFLVTLSLITTLSIGGAYAFAQTSNDTTSPQSIQQRCGFKKNIGFKGRDFVISVMKNKFNISDDEINATIKDGKNMQDLLEKKNISHDKFKEELIKAKEKSIDEAVSKGKITKEQGETFKSHMKENSEKYFQNGNRHGRKNLKTKNFNNECPLIQDK